MLQDWNMKWYEFLSQTPDRLLTQKEADEVISRIEGDEYTEIVSKVIEKILESKTDLSKEEIFYITSRAEIIDAINSRSNYVAKIIQEQWETGKQQTPISIVMALALNEIIVQLANSCWLANITKSKSKKSYITEVQYAHKRKHGQSTFRKQNQSRALRKVLQRRSELYSRREGLKYRLEQDTKNEQIVQWLIEKWVLIHHKWTYKISWIRAKKATRKMSVRLHFKKTIDWTSYTIQRSISEYWYEEAFRMILEKVQEAFNLSPNEISALNNSKYCRQELYT